MNRFGQSQAPRGRALYRTKGEVEAALLEANRKLIVAEIKVREIHEALGKRGDHGLMGNLACILDHVCRKGDPKPL